MTEVEVEAETEGREAVYGGMDVRGCHARRAETSGWWGHLC